MVFRSYDAATCGGEPARNAIVGRVGRFCHEPVFGNFTPLWLASPAELVDASGRAMVVDWLGVRYDREDYCHASYYRQRVAHALRVELCDLLEWISLRPSTAAFPLRLPLPLISEEYFEYVDVLETVVEYVATQSRRRHTRGSPWIRPYRILEIGAGFGMWSLAAHAALRQLVGARGDRTAGTRGSNAARPVRERTRASTPMVAVLPMPPVPFEAYLVEADPLKIPTIRATLALNGLVPSTALSTVHNPAGVATGSPVALVEHAALAPSARQHRGKPSGSGKGANKALLGGHLGFYAVHTLPHVDARARTDAVYVNTTDLPSLLTRLKAGRVSPWAKADEASAPADRDASGIVDLLDMDVQGAEYTVLDDAAMDALDAQVLRVHIGTHGKGTKNVGLFNRVNSHERDERDPTPAVERLSHEERQIASKFFARGWRPRWLLGQNAGNCDHAHLFRVTEYGFVCMADGALAFINPRAAAIQAYDTET